MECNSLIIEKLNSGKIIKHLQTIRIGEMWLQNNKFWEIYKYHSEQPHRPNLKLIN